MLHNHSIVLCNHCIDHFVYCVTCCLTHVNRVFRYTMYYMYHWLMYLPWSYCHKQLLNLLMSHSDSLKQQLTLYSHRQYKLLDNFHPTCMHAGVPRGIWGPGIVGNKYVNGVGYSLTCTSILQHILYSVMKVWGLSGGSHPEKWYIFGGSIMSSYTSTACSSSIHEYHYSS